MTHFDDVGGLADYPNLETVEFTSVTGLTDLSLLEDCCAAPKTRLTPGRDVSDDELMTTSETYLSEAGSPP